MGYFIALQNIQLPPGSGVNAYVVGARIPGELVEQWGIQELVRPVEGDQSPGVRVRPPTPPSEATAQDDASAVEELNPTTE